MAIKWTVHRCYVFRVAVTFVPWSQSVIVELGESRFRRGIRTAALVDYIAARLGQGSGWNLATVPDVGHDHTAMTPPAVRHLLPASHYNRPACQRAIRGD